VCTLAHVFGKVDSTYVALKTPNMEGRVKVAQQFSIDKKCKTLKHRGKE
jgi:hypothetical protein